jgi:hypothetical protein
LNGFHYFIDTECPRADFSRQLRLWQGLSPQERQHYNEQVASHSYLEGFRDQADYLAVKDFDKPFQSNYNVFFSEQIRKMNYITKQQLAKLTEEQWKALQGLFKEDIRSMSLEQLNKAVAYQVDHSWSKSELARFRSIVPSVMSDSIKDYNKQIAEEWKVMPAHKKERYEYLSYLSKVKFVDMVIHQRTRPRTTMTKKPPKPTPTRKSAFPTTPINFDDDEYAEK